ncbi:MAG: nucleotidyltransferase [Acidobacteria bacterium]|nr:MAG: nucleotidyltransferase [Acidobacteriota bacterium]
MLDLGSLAKAVSALDAVLAKSEDSTFMRTLDATARNAVRAGVIQHFEFTYELCWKFMKRWLGSNLSPSAVDGISRRQLFRLAAENHLITEIEPWMRYHAGRNLVAHTYIPEVAAQVYELIPAFAANAAALLRALEQRND